MQRRIWIFASRKKGSETKKRTKEEEIEKGNCRPPTWKVVLRLWRTWTKRYLIFLLTRKWNGWSACVSSKRVWLSSARWLGAAWIKSDNISKKKSNEDCQKWSELGELSKIGSKSGALGSFLPQLYVWQRWIWVFHSLYFHWKTHESPDAETSEGVLFLFRNL